MNIYKLRNKEKELLIGEILKFTHIKNINNRQLLEKCNPINKVLCKIEGLTELYTIFKKGNHSFIIIDNLPITNTIPNVFQLIAIGLSKFLGEAFQYKEQNFGKLNGHLTPIEKFSGIENTGQGNGSFGWHSDDAILTKDLRTEWIQLLCEDNTANTVTQITLVDDIINKLTAKDIEILLEERFYFRSPHSFNLNSNSINRKGSILSLINGKYEINYSSYNCLPLDRLDKEAIFLIRKIAKIADEHAIDLMLKPGQAVIFNNNRVIHRRNKVSGNRSLYRTYIKKDLSSLHNVKGNKENIFSIFDLYKYMENINVIQFNN